jgi:AsmA protein
MPRRILFAVLIACFAVLAAAVVPWRLSSDALRSWASGPLRRISGLELTAAGPGTIALLPVPRLRLDSITLAAPDGTPVVRGGPLKGEIRILPLLIGRLEFAELALSGAAIDVELGNEATGWEQAIAGLRTRLDPGEARGHLKRFLLKRATLRLHDRRTGFETTVEDINLAADWPTPTSLFGVTGSLTWRGEAVQIKAASLRPEALTAGRASPLTIEASAPLAGLALTGELTLRDEQQFSGRAAFMTRSLRDFTVWSGVALPLSDVVGPFALDGDVRAVGQGISWPAARLTLGNDRLVGALLWRADGERRTITGTLAADRLDLTGFATPLTRLRPSSGGWSSIPFNLPPQNGTDLDLRLSASTARIGPTRVDDLAANVLVKSGRYEASVNRATINKGVVKGRASLTQAGDGIELKAQSTFDRLDVAALLADLGLPRWANGSAQGQFAFEGAGSSPAEIVRTLHGRATTSVRAGELLGLGLTDMLRRADSTSEIAWRGGRTPFEQAHVHMTIADGIAEIADARLSASGIRAAMQGRSSIMDRTLEAQASVEAAGQTPGPASTMSFDITGPWSALSIAVGARSLTQRSDAAGSAAAVR